MKLHFCSQSPKIGNPVVVLTVDLWRRKITTKLLASRESHFDVNLVEQDTVIVVEYDSASGILTFQGDGPGGQLSCVLGTFTAPLYPGFQAANVFDLLTSH
jgi:hypothetical protein